MRGGGSDYVHGAVASVDKAECVEYAAAACVVDGWEMGEGRGRRRGQRGRGMYKLEMYGTCGRVQSMKHGFGSSSGLDGWRLHMLRKYWGGRSVLSCRPRSDRLGCSQSC